MAQDRQPTDNLLLFLIRHIPLVFRGQISQRSLHISNPTHTYPNLCDCSVSMTHTLLTCVTYDFGGIIV